MTIEDAKIAIHESIHNRRITAIVLDYALTLELKEPDKPPVSLRIETSFFFGKAGGALRYDPNDVTSLGSVLTILGATIKKVDVSASCALTLTRSNDFVIMINPDEQFESWQITNISTRELIVCLPGGQLSNWS